MEWTGAKLVDPSCYTAADVDASGNAAIAPSTVIQVVNGSGDALCIAPPSPPASPALSSGDIVGIAVGSVVGAGILLGALVISTSASVGGGAVPGVSAGVEL